MKELEVTLRVRNNRLKERRLALGLSQKKLADAVGISFGGYCQLESMSASPKCSNKRVGFGPGAQFVGERWRDIASELACFYGVTEEELFPDAVLNVDRAVAVRKVDVNDLPMLMSDHEVRRLTEGPEEALEAREMGQAVNDAIAKLPAQYANVLRARMAGFELSEIGKMFPGPTGGTSAESVRQRELEALSILRRDGRKWRR